MAILTLRWHRESHKALREAAAQSRRSMNVEAASRLLASLGQDGFLPSLGPVLGAARSVSHRRNGDGALVVAGPDDLD